MKILIDANVALDVLLERQPFYISGVKVLGLSKGGIELFISASTVTDIYYIIRKELKIYGASHILGVVLPPKNAPSTTVKWG